MKNICIFTNTLLSGGAEKQAVLLSKALNENYKVWLVVYYGDEIEQKFLNTVESNQINVICLYGNHFKKLFTFYRFLRQKKIEAIFSYLLTTNLIGGVMGRLAGVKRIFSGIRNAELAKNKVLIQRFIQNKLTTKTIYNNYRGLRILSERKFNEKKGIVIPNCFINNNSLIMRKEKKIIEILSLGRFVHQKDCFIALESVKKLRENFKNFKYTFVGYGELESKIRQWVSINNASSYVEIVINPVNINDYYKNADIYLQTSLFEGLSNTVMEAMSFSLPLVLTVAGDNNRLVIDGENGYISEPRNVVKLSNDLCELCHLYEKRIEFGKASFHKLKNNYSFKQFQENYYHLLEDFNV